MAFRSVKKNKMQSSTYFKLNKFYLSFYLLLAIILFFGGCNIFKTKPIPKQPQYIEALINNKPQKFIYQVRGSYNKEKHVINLRGNDTFSVDANALVINIELGKDTTLAMLKFPRTFSAYTDTLPKRQITYAAIHWDNMKEDVLYENYTYRRKNDLKITFSAFSKDSLLTGTFSGTLFQKKKYARLRDGKFSVYIKSH
jgi:hypothetical protein